MTTVAVDILASFNHMCRCLCINERAKRRRRRKKKKADTLTIRSLQSICRATTDKKEGWGGERRGKKPPKRKKGRERDEANLTNH